MHSRPVEIQAGTPNLKQVGTTRPHARLSNVQTTDSVNGGSRQSLAIDDQE